MSLALVVTLTPYRMTEAGPEFLEAGMTTLAWGDAFEAAQQNEDVAKFLTAVHAAGQQFVSEARF